MIDTECKKKMELLDVEIQGQNEIMQTKLAHAEQRAKSIVDEAMKEQELLKSHREEAKKRLSQVKQAIQLSEEKAREDANRIITKAEDKANNIIQEAKTDSSNRERNTKEKCQEMSETKKEIAEKQENIKRLQEKAEKKFMSVKRK